MDAWNRRLRHTDWPAELRSKRAEGIYRAARSGGINFWPLMMTEVFPHRRIALMTERNLKGGKEETKDSLSNRPRTDSQFGLRERQVAKIPLITR